MSEHEHQAALFQWAKLQEGVYPDLRWLYAIPNGGHRHKAVAGRMRAEGQKSGVCDIHMPLARGGYIGLWIEMKHGKNKPSLLQAEWIAAMRMSGHKVLVCYDWETARDEVLAYIAMVPTTITAGILVRAGTL
jgi:hypothetical protein